MYASRRAQGTSKWIGTTEAAALLSCQGVSVRVIDFKTRGEAV